MRQTQRQQGRPECASLLHCGKWRSFGLVLSCASQQDWLQRPNCKIGSKGHQSENFLYVLSDCESLHCYLHMLESHK